MATTDSDVITTTTADGATQGTRAAAPTRDVRRAATITLVIICAAVFLTALDQLVVATALLPISASLALDFTHDIPAISWIISGYLLGYVIMMPLMGRVSDLYGRRRVLLAALVLFAIGSVICAEAADLGSAFDLGFLKTIGITSPSPALTWLVIARFIQAVGGGAVVPVAIAAIGDLFGDRRRILALGVIGGITEAGGALGPLYGALIVQKWTFLPGGIALGSSGGKTAHIFDFSQSWQWIFLLNIPLVAIIVAALFFLWPKRAMTTATTPTPARHSRRSLDWPGATLLGGALLCTSLGLGQEAGAVSTLSQAQVSQNNPLLLVAAVVLLLAFILVESRTHDPIIPLTIFRSPAFSAGALFSLLLGVALIVALISIPLYVFAVFGTDHYIDAGLALLRMTVMIPIGAFGGGWLVTRIGTRAVGAAGATATGIGFLLMHLWSVDTTWSQITIGTVIAGLGFGLIVAPISTTALNTTDARHFGVSAAVVTSLRMIGMMLGLAGISSWGVGLYQQLASQIPPIRDLTNASQVAAFENALTKVSVHVATNFFLVGMVLGLLAIIPALFLWRPKPGEQRQQGESVITMGL